MVSWDQLFYSLLTDVSPCPALSTIAHCSFIFKISGRPRFASRWKRITIGRRQIPANTGCFDVLQVRNYTRGVNLFFHWLSAVTECTQKRKKQRQETLRTFDSEVTRIIYCNAATPKWRLSRFLFRPPQREPFALICSETLFLRYWKRETWSSPFNSFIRRAPNALCTASWVPEFNSTGFFLWVHKSVWFQAFAAVWMRPALFCDSTHIIMVVSCRRFGSTYPPHPQGPSSPRMTSWPFEVKTDGLSRNVGKKLPFCAA